MEYLKSYESYYDYEPNYNEGDIVVCINDADYGTRKGDKYIVDTIFSDDDNGKREPEWYVYLRYIHNEELLANHLGDPIWYLACRYKTEAELAANKYNL